MAVLITRGRSILTKAHNYGLLKYIPYFASSMILEISRLIICCNDSLISIGTIKRINVLPNLVIKPGLFRRLSYLSAVNLSSDLYVTLELSVIVTGIVVIDIPSPQQHETRQVAPVY